VWISAEDDARIGAESERLATIAVDAWTGRRAGVPRDATARILALAPETRDGGGGIRTLGTVSGPPAFKMGGRMAVLGSV
jgi:hypothetical protein